MSISQWPVIFSRRNASGKCSRSEMCLVSSYSRRFSSQVGLLHAAQREDEPLAGQQPVVQVCPRLVGDEPPGGVAALEVEGALGLPRRPQRELVHLAVQRGRLLLQEQVEVVVGELVAQEVEHLARLLDLPLVVVQLVQRLVAAPLGAEDLAVRSARSRSAAPASGGATRRAALPAGVGLIHPAVVLSISAELLHDPGDRLEHVGELGAERDPARSKPASAEPGGAENEVGDRVHDLADGLDHVGVRACDSAVLVRSWFWISSLIRPSGPALMSPCSRAGWPG